MVRFLYSLIALALVLSPLAMSQSGMAMAHSPAGAAAGMEDAHCGESHAPAQEGKAPKAMPDCTGVCAALAAAENCWDAGEQLLAEAIQPPNVPVLSGLNPESDPPPPRLS